MPHVLHLLLLLALAHHPAAAPDLSGDVVTSEYLLLTRPPAAALFDCDAWDDTLHVTLQIMSCYPTPCDLPSHLIPVPLTLTLPPSPSPSPFPSPPCSF